MPSCRHTFKIYSGDIEQREGRTPRYSWICAECNADGFTSTAGPPPIPNRIGYARLKYGKDPTDSYWQGVIDRYNHDNDGQVRINRATETIHRIESGRRRSVAPDAQALATVTLESAPPVESMIDRLQQEMQEYSRRQQNRILSIDVESPGLAPNTRIEYITLDSATAHLPIREEE